MTETESGFCEAVTRRQFEATTWADAHLGCGRRTREKADGRWACYVHRDPAKRYGWNEPVTRGAT